MYFCSLCRFIALSCVCVCMCMRSSKDTHTVRISQRSYLNSVCVMVSREACSRSTGRATSRLRFSPPSSLHKVGMRAFTYAVLLSGSWAPVLTCVCVDSVQVKEQTQTWGGWQGKFYPCSNMQILLSSTWKKRVEGKEREVFQHADLHPELESFVFMSLDKRYEGQLSSRWLLWNCSYLPVEGDQIPCQQKGSTASTQFLPWEAAMKGIFCWAFCP